MCITARLGGVAQSHEGKCLGDDRLIQGYAKDGVCVCVCVCMCGGVFVCV